MTRGEAVIDLRSDTAARASSDMLAAMARAETSRYLPEEDRESVALEAAAAQCLGHEDALFLPTATMANLVALLVHTRPGDVVAIPRDAHVLVAEAGGLTAVAGVVLQVSESEETASLLPLFESASDRAPVPVLAWLENTHTQSGGSLTDAEQFRRYVTAAHGAGARIHVDGARLPNAAAALEVEWSDLAAPADSVTLSLNKGLGAPVGAILAGPASFTRAARIRRERLGGGWRKAGNLAAAGRLALQTGNEVLVRDHLSAARIAEGLARVAGCTVRPPETNIVHGVFADSTSRDRFLEHLGGRQILANARPPATIRFVAHSALGEAELGKVLAAIDEYGAEGSAVVHSWPSEQVRG